MSLYVHDRGILPYDLVRDGEVTSARFMSAS